jgi:hypothetical protein
VIDRIHKEETRVKISKVLGIPESTLEKYD